MQRYLLGLLVRAVRLLMIFRTRSVDRAQRLLQYTMLERLRIGQQQNGTFGKIIDTCRVL